MSVTQALRKDHRRVVRLLRVLERKIDVFARSEAPDSDIIVGVANYFLQYPDRCHHPEEDLIVAKLIESHSEAAGVVALVNEHRELREKTLRFRRAVNRLVLGTEVSRPAIVAAARDFIAAKHRYMREEKCSLFPTAVRVLTSAEWADIEVHLSHQAGSAQGSWVDEMFRGLGERVLSLKPEVGQAAT